MKNIFRNNACVSVVLCMMFCFGCKKNEQKNITQKNKDSLQVTGDILDIIESYYLTQNTKVQGRFLFESEVPNNDPHIKNTVLLGGNFYDEDVHARLFGGDASIGKNLLKPNTDGAYGFDKALSRDGLFGTDVTFSFIPPKHAISIDKNGATTNKQPVTDPDDPINPGSGTPVTTTIYSPAAIYLTNVLPQTPVTLVPNSPLTIAWNVDPNNKIGVTIIAEYMPQRPFNEIPIANGYNSSLTNSVLVTDNGSTTLPWSFFKNFPVGGHIILWVARGNYAIASDGTYNYQVGGYSATAIWDFTITPAPPIINGGSAVYLNSSTTSSGGTITASPGTVVTVSVSAGGPSGSFYSEFDLSGATFTSNSSGGSGTILSATNSNQTATFTMPASGSVTWQGSYSCPNSSGSGSISVY